MPKRTTVELNFGVLLPLIKKTNRSYTVFCEKMSRKPQWVTDWQRGKNLPSPEEAAQMCAILQVDPEEILTVPEDVEKVRALMNSQKSPLPNGNELTEDEIQLLTQYRDLSEQGKEYILQTIAMAAKTYKKSVRAAEAME